MPKSSFSALFAFNVWILQQEHSCCLFVGSKTFHLSFKAVSKSQLLKYLMNDDD
jgi:hypothetical protein